MFGNYITGARNAGAKDEPKRPRGAAPPSRYTKATTSGPQGAADVRCQKCLKLGHYTYDCKNSVVYKTRPSRSQQLLKPSKKGDKPSVATPAEFGGSGQAVTGSGTKLAITEGLAAKILDDKKKERKTRGRSASSSSSSSSSDSSSSDSSDSSDSDSDSSSSSSGSDSDSDSESDSGSAASDRKGKKKSSRRKSRRSASKSRSRSRSRSPVRRRRRSSSRADEDNKGKDAQKERRSASPVRRRRRSTSSRRSGSPA